MRSFLVAEYFLYTVQCFKKVMTKNHPFLILKKKTDEQQQQQHIKMDKTSYS